MLILFTMFSCVHGGTLLLRSWLAFNVTCFLSFQTSHAKYRVLRVYRSMHLPSMVSCLTLHRNSTHTVYMLLYDAIVPLHISSVYVVNAVEINTEHHSRQPAFFVQVRFSLFISNETVVELSTYSHVIFITYFVKHLFCELDFIVCRFIARSPATFNFAILIAQTL